jgi:hypothetical protein
MLLRVYCASGSSHGDSRTEEDGISTKRALLSNVQVPNYNRFDPPSVVTVW